MRGGGGGATLTVYLTVKDPFLRGLRGAPKSATPFSLEILSGVHKGNTRFFMIKSGVLVQKLLS